VVAAPSRPFAEQSLVQMVRRQVLLAAAGVFGTGTGWPDIIVAAIMAALGISGGWQIVRQARSELDSRAVPMAAV
jgi:hypothetical protein